MMSCFNKIMPGLTKVPPQLLPLHICSLQCYHMQPTAWILLAAYSLDLAPSDLHLLREDLRSQHFSSDEEVKDAVCQWFMGGEDFFMEGIKKLVKWCQKCIEVGGNYVEK